MKANALTVSLLLALSGITFAGNERGIDPMLAPPPMTPPPMMPTSFYGPGWNAGAHALFLTPDSERNKDVFGAGLNLDYFLNSNIGFQASGSWADPGTDEIWHNYTLDFIVRAPIEQFAPYMFAGGGAILEDSANVLGRAGLGLEFRTSSTFGLFADWSYSFPGGGGGPDDIEDYQMIRAGIKIGF